MDAKLIEFHATSEDRHVKENMLLKVVENGLFSSPKTCESIKYQSASWIAGGLVGGWPYYGPAHDFGKDFDVLKFVLPFKSPETLAICCMIANTSLAAMFARQFGSSCKEDEDVAKLKIHRDSKCSRNIKLALKCIGGVLAAAPLSLLNDPRDGTEAILKFSCSILGNTIMSATSINRMLNNDYLKDWFNYLRYSSDVYKHKKNLIVLRKDIADTLRRGRQKLSNIVHNENGIDPIQKAFNELVSMDKPNLAKLINFFESHGEFDTNTIDLQKIIKELLRLGGEKPIHTQSCCTKYVEGIVTYLIAAIILGLGNNIGYTDNAIVDLEEFFGNFNWPIVIFSAGIFNFLVATSSANMTSKILNFRERWRNSDIRRINPIGGGLLTFLLVATSLLSYASGAGLFTECEMLCKPDFIKDLFQLYLSPPSAMIFNGSEMTNLVNDMVLFRAVRCSNPKQRVLAKIALRIDQLFKNMELTDDTIFLRNFEKIIDPQDDLESGQADHNEQDNCEIIARRINETLDSNPAVLKTIDYGSTSQETQRTARPSSDLCGWFCRLFSPTPIYDEGEKESFALMPM